MNPAPVTKSQAPVWQRDAASLDAVARGDEAAFESLFNNHYRRVYRLANGILRDREEAREVAQEVFLKLYRAAPSWQPRARIETWLHRVTVNCALSLQRRLKVAARGLLLPEPARGPERTAALNQSVARVRAALDSLAPRQRAMAVLHLDYELKPAEIAEAMKMTSNAVRVGLFRALKRLREAAGPSIPLDAQELSLLEQAENQS